jgi:hypothetical protein
LTDTMSSHLDLRIASIFIIAIASALGVFPPVVARPSQATMAGIPFACAKVSF